jgi:hypothetical protein
MTTSTKTKQAGYARVKTSSLAAPNHDHVRRAGCDQVVRIGDLVAWLGESTYTLRKWSAIGSLVFPRYLRLRNGRVATTCYLTKAWLAEVSS